MLKKLSCFSFVVGLSFFTSVDSLNAFNMQVKSPLGQVYYQDNQDVWYGPGYYYGIWFDTEENYWEWRGNNADYPVNYGYYNQSYPIYYYGHDHHHDDEHEEHHEHEEHGGEHRSGGHGGGHGGGHH